MDVGAVQEAATSSQGHQAGSGRSQPAASEPLGTDVSSSVEGTFPGAKSWAELGATVVFEKVLTSSDINPHGRIVVPKVNIVNKTFSCHAYLKS